MTETIATAPSFFSRLRLYISLSRTTHGVFELAAPSVAALLALGATPPALKMILALFTAMAGYTAVYALNDLMDIRADRERIKQGGFQDTEIMVESGLIRHPMAQGVLSLKQGLFWAGGWAIVALIGCYLLNPVCALIFLIGAGLEAIYCLMLKVSHFRTLLHGIVKSTGAVAGIFAFSLQPSSPLVIILFLWIYFWEIGGQNIPADWHDQEEDQLLEAKTIPLLFGPDRAGQAVLGALVISVILSMVLLLVGAARLSLTAYLLVLASGLYLLILPALRLYRIKNRTQAGALFSKATLYPPAVYVIVQVSVLL